jgi:hypothetical protein
MIVRLFLVTAAAASFSAAAILDDFNRPDASTLGPNWTVVSGGAQIISNQAAGLSNLSLVVYNGVSASGAYVDVYNTGNALQYAALVLGYSGINDNYFIKVQNQSGGNSFGNYAFYYGNNGSGGGGGGFFGLNTPFSSGRIWATYSGTTAWLFIDSDFDGVADQQYSHTYSAAVSGSGIGLGFYGATRVDNFGAGPPVQSEIPEPGTFGLALAGLGAATLLRLRRRRA